MSAAVAPCETPAPGERIRIRNYQANPILNGMTIVVEAVLPMERGAVIAAGNLSLAERWGDRWEVVR